MLREIYAELLLAFPIFMRSCISVKRLFNIKSLRTFIGLLSILLMIVYLFLNKSIYLMVLEVLFVIAFSVCTIIIERKHSLGVTVIRILLLWAMVTCLFLDKHSWFFVILILDCVLLLIENARKEKTGLSTEDDS